MRKGAERYDDGNTHLDTCGGELECGGPVDSCEQGGKQTADVCFSAGCGDQMLGGEEECRSQAVRSSGSWFSRSYRLMKVAVEGRRQRGAVVHFRGFAN